MNKRECVLEILQGQDYKVLNDKNGHIRMNQMNVDIYANTGTIKHNGKWYKKGQGIKKLRSLFEKKEKTLSERVEALESQVKHLTECSEDALLTIEANKHI